MSFNKANLQNGAKADQEVGGSNPPGCTNQLFDFQLFDSYGNFCAIFSVLTYTRAGQSGGNKAMRLRLGRERLPRKRPAGCEPVKAGSQRRPGILQHREQWGDDLVKLYSTTDLLMGRHPSKASWRPLGRQSLSGGMCGEILLWAQSHLAGYEMLKAQPELRKHLEELLAVP